MGLISHTLLLIFGILLSIAGVVPLGVPIIFGSIVVEYVTWHVGVDALRYIDSKMVDPEADTLAPFVSV